MLLKVLTTGECEVGTNYYLINVDDPKDHINKHIGKRSAAGRFCRKCGCGEFGSEEIHHKHKDPVFRCPSCNGDLLDESVGMHVCSFSWTKLAHKWFLLGKAASEEKLVVDEYGKQYTAYEFFKELEHVRYEMIHPYEFS